MVTRSPRNKPRPYVLRNKRVTLIDLGLDNMFDVSMGYVQSIMTNINVGLPAPIADVDFIRTRNEDLIWQAMLDTCDVLHVMAHGVNHPGMSGDFIRWKRMRFHGTSHEVPAGVAGASGPVGVGVQGGLSQ